MCCPRNALTTNFHELYEYFIVEWDMNSFNSFNSWFSWGQLVYYCLKITKPSPRLDYEKTLLNLLSCAVLHNLKSTVGNQ